MKTAKFYLRPTSKVEPSQIWTSLIFSRERNNLPNVFMFGRSINARLHLRVGLSRINTWIVRLYEHVHLTGNNQYKASRIGLLSLWVMPLIQKVKSYCHEIASSDCTLLPRFTLIFICSTSFSILLKYIWSSFDIQINDRRVNIPRTSARKTDHYWNCPFGQKQTESSTHGW